VGYKLTWIHLVSPAQFSSGRISATSGRATNYLYGSPIYGASDFFSQGDTDRSRLPLALTGHRLLQDRLFFGCDQYAAGGKKVRFPALSNEIFEMSGVNMIRPEHGVEAIESASPPELKGIRIKIRLKHTPACFYQIVDSLFDRHC
jgi:hypothetical protein